MPGEDSPILRRETFPPTGGEWFVRENGIIELTLGPKVEEAKHVTAEAHWSVDLLEQLKEQNPRGVWTVVTNLERLPPRYNPPLALRAVYAGVLKDPRLRRIAIVHASKTHRMVVQTFLLTSSSRHKLKFFDTIDEARAWVVSEGE